MKTQSLMGSLALMGFLMISGWACKSDDDSPTVAPPATPNYDISQRSTTQGNVLTDQKGRTLYFFTKDANGTSVCTGGCLDVWPIFSAATPRLDTGLVAKDFGSITRADGKTQVTFKGWPLYYYASDAVAGDVKGENVGNIWIVAKKSYSIMLSNTQLVGEDGKNYTADTKEGTGDTQYFVDDTGRTLYAFAKDKKNKNNFTNADSTHNAIWPIYEGVLKNIPSALDKTLFGTIDVLGKKQITYKGWPLYYYGPDNKTRGLTKGVSVPKPGIWPIVQKDTPAATE